MLVRVLWIIFPLDHVFLKFIYLFSGNFMHEHNVFRSQEPLGTKVWISMSILISLLCYDKIPSNTWRPCHTDLLLAWWKLKYILVRVTPRYIIWGFCKGCYFLVSFLVLFSFYTGRLLISFKLILYPTTWLKVFISCGSSLVEFLGVTYVYYHIICE